MTDLVTLRRIAKRYGIRNVIFDPSLPEPVKGWLVVPDLTVVLHPDLPFWAHVFLLLHEIGHLIRMLEGRVDPEVAEVYAMLQQRATRKAHNLLPDPHLEATYWGEETLVNEMALFEMQSQYRGLTDQRELAELGLCYL